MSDPAARHRSPTPALLVGLIITLATVVGYSWYISGQISRLRALQTDLTDRNRRDSLQLLRIQNDLNQLGLAMRDMLDADQPYPLTAWSAQFERIRDDLTDALLQQERVAATRRTPEQTRALTSALSQFWDAVDRMFAVAQAGRDAEARAQVRVSLQARQAALNTAVARLLVQNNASEAETASRVQAIYDQVQGQVYWFLAATLAAIVATSLYLIRANRRLFARLTSLSDERRELARTLITTRESTLREIARELHDEFGQLLTAMGSMLGRAARQTPADSPLRSDLHEIGEVAQAALENVRGLSQTLHPSILEELGLDSAIVSYLSTVERQLGVKVAYERHGEAVPVDDNTAIHVYRVLQEALSNVARHSGAAEARVHLRFEADTLTLEVEDRGRGFTPGDDRRASGLGLVAMRERADLLGGTLDILRPAGGGTLVRLRVPVKAVAST
ncbi:MAG TPA: ATP-binding protein [Vicinamibacterales bacterium]|nr:ATP-binding protein [Vicinamibacterales bacterium]